MSKSSSQKKGNGSLFGGPRDQFPALWAESPMKGRGNGSLYSEGTRELRELLGTKKPPQEPFARERVIAASFAKECPLPPGKTEELARLLSAYREELREAWQAEARARAKRAR